MSSRLYGSSFAPTIKLTWKGTWNSAFDYIRGNIVTYSNSSYIAQSSNSGKEPDNYPSYWSVLSQGIPSIVGTDILEMVDNPSMTLSQGISLLDSAVNGVTTGSTIQDRIANIDDLLLISPTGILSNDLSTARSLLVSTLGANLQTDIRAINSTINGQTTGYTTQDRISVLSNMFLINPTGNLANDISTITSLLFLTPGANLQTDIQNMNSSLNGIATGSTTQERIGALGSASSIKAMMGINNVSSLTSALGNTGAGNSSIASLLGNNTNSLYNSIVGQNGISQ